MAKGKNCCQDKTQFNKTLFQGNNEKNIKKNKVFPWTRQV